MTPSRWMVGAPWWAYWLISAAMTAVVLTGVSVGLFSGFAAADAWPWKAAVMSAFGLAFGAVMVYAQQPTRLACATALEGLSWRQRSAALVALRRGNVPEDPAALAGAIRIGAMGIAHLNRVSTSQRTARWLLPLLYTFIAVLALIGRDWRRGALWLGFAVYFAAFHARLTLQARRLPPNVDKLRVAAIDVPEAALAAAQTADGVRHPLPRKWTGLITVVITVAFFAVANQVWGSPLLLGSR